ncbi:hypothetical protein AURDEDRAFT_183478 [Auricularia subglabra TFB-10046 SS5]|nr:hypothetical protein AURDEDRAFT_183478 [Auricularia subglabra TFB-10046 SS5]
MAKPPARGQRISPRRLGAGSVSTPPEPQSFPPERILATRVGNTDVASLLKASAKPTLPEGLTLLERVPYFDEILKWVLEREPAASKIAISRFVYALGGGQVSEKSFQGSYRDESDIRRYYDIRDSVLNRWESGELGQLGEHRAGLARISRHYPERRNSPNAPTDRQKEPEETQNGDGDQIDSIADEVATPPPNNHVMSEHGEEHEDIVDRLGEDIDEAPAASRKNGDHHGLPGHNEIAGQILAPSDAMKQEDQQLRELALYTMCFEDYVARYNPKHEEQEAKRAIIWAFMLRKHGRDEMYWQSLYARRKGDVEMHIEQLRCRPSSSAGGEDEVRA